MKIRMDKLDNSCLLLRQVEASEYMIRRIVSGFDVTYDVYLISIDQNLKIIIE